eukprot:1398439-Heterocapsa_arctica.AAC.1
MTANFFGWVFFGQPPVAEEDGDYERRREADLALGRKISLAAMRQRADRPLRSPVNRRGDLRD